MLAFVSQSYGRLIKHIITISLVLAGVYLIVVKLNNDNEMPSLTANDRNHLSSAPLGWKAIRQVEIDYWKNIQVETMTAQQILDFFNWSNHTACTIYHYFGGKIVDYGGGIYARGVDGQYPVCLDRAVRPLIPCIVYSFGIRGEWSFEEALERYGCEIFAFDPSMSKGDHDHSRKIHFYKLGLGPKDLNSTAGDWKLKTLDSVYRMLKPRHGKKMIDYLKIDIEWNEWEALKQIAATDMLSKVRQLSVEFHLPHQNKGKRGSNMNMAIHDYRILVGLVKSIEKKMTRYSSRGILWGHRQITSLDEYQGNVCFEMSFYQTLHDRESITQ